MGNPEFKSGYYKNIIIFFSRSLRNEPCVVERKNKYCLKNNITFVVLWRVDVRLSVPEFQEHNRLKMRL